MGAVSDAIARSARDVRRRDPHQRTRRADAGPRRRRGRRGAGERRGARTRRSSSPRSTRRSRSSTRSTRHELPADFVRDIESWKTRSGVVKINLALGELPDFTADPGTQPAGAPHRVGRDGASVEYIERAFQDAREGRPALRAVHRRRDPDDARQDAGARGRAHHVDVHAVGPARVGRRAAPRRARGVRRPHDRLLRRAGAELQGARSCTATSSGRTRWSRSTA